MKRVIVISTLVVLVLITACATTGSGTGLSLQEAIEQSAERITNDLSQGSRVAIVAFESPNDGLSNFIMEELTGALFDRGIEVADRQNLEYVYRELNFQMSGDVSDETAVSIGKFLGTEFVITGDFSNVGNKYRYRTNAINVEQAVRASVSRFDVAGGREMRNMITSLASHKAVGKTVSSDGSEQTAPKTAGAYLDRGITLASQGEWEMAILDFNEAIELNPNLSAAYLLRGRATYASVSDILYVAEDFERVFTYLEGELSAEQIQAYDRAIADFTEAIRLDGNNAVAYSDRGDVYHQKRDYDSAVENYNQAIRLNPRYAWAYFKRGWAYDTKGDTDKAIADYTQAIRLDPNFAWAYFNRAYAYYNPMAGDYDRAIADFTQAIRLDPNNVWPYLGRGDIYFNRGLNLGKPIADFNRAISDFTQAIRLDPNSAGAYRSRGDAYMEKRNYDRAIADFTHIIQLRQRLGEPSYYVSIAYNVRGDAYYKKRDYDQAIADFEEALRIDPDNTNAKKNLENARKARGR